MVTSRAASARDEAPGSVPEPEPVPEAAPDTVAGSSQEEDPDLVVRLHHEVVDTPAPRRALSPAQALHLATEGPTLEREPTITDDGTLVLPSPRPDRTS